MSKALSYLQALAFKAPPNSTFNISFAKSKGFFSSLWGDNPLATKESFKSMDRFMERAKELLFDPKLKYLHASAVDKYGQEIFTQSFNK